jgi:hypothetical protein
MQFAALTRTLIQVGFSIVAAVIAGVLFNLL